MAAAQTQPLLVFSRLTALESLQISGKATRVQVTVAEAAALTTSSHLTCLVLTNEHLGGFDEPLINSMQRAHYEAMFPSGRQLQQLHELQVGTALLSSEVDLGQLTGLRCLALTTSPADISTYGSMGAMRVAAGLKALTTLKDLVDFRLRTTGFVFPAEVWRESLAALTGLTSLTVWCGPSSGEHLLPLTSCRCLENLYVFGGADEQMGFVPGFELHLGLSSKVRACLVRHTKKLAVLASSVLVYTRVVQQHQPLGGPSRFSETHAGVQKQYSWLPA